MPHIHTNPGEHDSTVSAFIVRLDTPEPQLLLHQHKKYHRLMQAGGHVELIETPWQTVLHEVTEETGYDPSQLEIMQPPLRLRSLRYATLHPVPVCDNTHEAAPGHLHSDRSYAFAAYSDPAHEPGEGESTEFRWISLEELDELPETEIGSLVRDVGAYVLQVCVPQWERVPLSEFKS